MRVGPKQECKRESKREKGGEDGGREKGREQGDKKWWEEFIWLGHIPWLALASAGGR